MKKRAPKIFLALFSFLIIAVVAILLWRPHIVTLVLEGYPKPVWPSGGAFHTVENPDATGLDGLAAYPPLSPKFSELFDQSAGRAIVVLQNGKLVFEHYADGYDPASKLNSYSMVKSLVGVLVLKALDEGKLSSLDEELGSAVPEFANLPVGDITIRGLLDMTSGLQFEKPAGSTGGDKKESAAEVLTFNPMSALGRLHVEGPAAIAQDVRIVENDIGDFSYQNANTAFLGFLLERLYDQSLSDLLAEKIWHPAGAGQFSWKLHDRSQVVTAYCCLYATPRDWALVGQFLMKNGDDADFLSPELHHYWMGDDLGASERQRGVYRSQTRYDVLNRSGERYSGPFTYMLGQGGQITYLFHKENLVVVRFGGQNQLLHSTLYEIDHTISNEGANDDPS